MRFSQSYFALIFPILPYKNVFVITCVKTTQMSSFFQGIIIWWLWTYPGCILKIWVDDVIFWRHHIFPHFRGLKQKSDDVRKLRHQLRFSKYIQHSVHVHIHHNDNPLKKWRLLCGFNTSNRINVFVKVNVCEKKLFYFADVIYNLRI